MILWPTKIKKPKSLHADPLAQPVRFGLQNSPKICEALTTWGITSAISAVSVFLLLSYERTQQSHRSYNRIMRKNKRNVKAK
jgi:hypothetical protein